MAVEVGAAQLFLELDPVEGALVRAEQVEKLFCLVIQGQGASVGGWAEGGHWP